MESDNYIKELRKGLGLTERELSKRTGIVYGHLQRLEYGQMSLERASFKTIVALCWELNVAPYKLFKNERLAKKIKLWHKKKTSKAK